MNKTNFTLDQALCQAPNVPMRNLKNALFLLLFSLLLSGCATSLITNLTPSRQPRSASGLYPIEMEFDTNQRTLREASLTPMVVVGFEAYPMRQTPKLPSRWEAVVPLPKDQQVLHYHFKVDYRYNAFGNPQKGSKLSSGYTLEIVD